MSILDKVVAAVTPPESAAARADARSKANAAATDGDWLSSVLEHHLGIEAAFAEVKTAKSAQTQRKAQKRLAILLTGHAIAEESVLYPALEKAGEKGHAGMGYTEQAAVKVQMALLEQLEPLTSDFQDKLEHIRGAVAHHVYEEENTWFLELRKSGEVDHAQLGARYLEEFERYVGQQG